MAKYDRRIKAHVPVLRDQVTPKAIAFAVEEGMTQILDMSAIDVTSVAVRVVNIQGIERYVCVETEANEGSAGDPHDFEPAYNRPKTGPNKIVRPRP